MKEMLYILLALTLIKITRNVIEVIKEKIALSQNLVVIENDYVSDHDIERAEVKMFTILGKEIHAGDKIKVITKFREKVEGMVIGVDTKSEAVILTMDTSVVDIQFKKIADVKLISRYGRFFTFKQ